MSTIFPEGSYLENLFRYTPPDTKIEITKDKITVITDYKQLAISMSYPKDKEPVTVLESQLYEWACGILDLM